MRLSVNKSEYVAQPVLFCVVLKLRKCDEDAVEVSLCVCVRLCLRVCLCLQPRLSDELTVAIRIKLGQRKRLFLAHAKRYTLRE